MDALKENRSCAKKVMDHLKRNRSKMKLIKRFTLRYTPYNLLLTSKREPGRLQPLTYQGIRVELIQFQVRHYAEGYKPLKGIRWLGV